MIKVLVVDDEVLLRAAFSSLIEAEDDLEVVGAAANGQQAAELADNLMPDVVVMDVRMPVLDGIEATRRITRDRPGSRVLILTTFDLDEYVFEALRAGASGFALKSRPPEELLSGIRTVAAGEALLAPNVTRRLIAHFTGRTTARTPWGLDEPMDQLGPAALAPPPGTQGGGGGPGHLLFGGQGALGIPPMPAWAMISVIAGWIVGWSAIGAWRMVTRDA